MNPLSEPLRPREFALLLLAAGDVTPRQRARDQQADRAGLSLKRRILEQLVTADPEPADMSAFLFALPSNLEATSGTIRSLSLAIMQEWQVASTSPTWAARHLELAQQCQTESTRRGQQLPG